MRAIRIVIFGLLSLISTTSYTHVNISNKIDSLTHELKQAKSNLDKARICNDLANLKITNSPQQAVNHSHDALNFIKDKDYSIQNIRAYRIIARYLHGQAKIDSALLQFNTALKISNQIKDNYQICAVTGEIGLCIQYLHGYDSAMYYFNKALNIAEQNKYHLPIINNLLFLAKAHKELVNYEKSLQALEKALGYCIKLNYQKPLSRIYLDMGILCFLNRDISSAYDNYIKSKEFCEKYSNKQRLSVVLANIGRLYSIENNSIKAIEFYNQSLKIKHELNYSLGVINTLILIGSEYHNLKQYDLGKKHLLQSLKLAKELNHKESESKILLDIGKICLDQKSYSESKKFATETIKIASKLNYKDSFMEANLLLANLYLVNKPLKLDSANHYFSCVKEYVTQKKNYAMLTEYYKLLQTYFILQNLPDSAQKYTELAFDVHDSIYSSEKNKEISNLQVQYETQIKEQQIESLTKDQQIKKAEIAKRNTIIILILLAMLVLGLIIIVLFYRYRARQQHTKLRLEKQNMQIQQQLELAHFKEDFFTNISHEFRTPLTLIISPLEEKLAKQGGNDPQLKLMHRNAHKLLKYINQILDISKSEKGEMPLQPSQINLLEFIQKIHQSYTPLADKKKINFKFDNHISNHLFHSDIDKLDKIINNLLSNAFKYTPDEQTVSISLNELPVINNKRHIEIIIEDTGDGISQQHLPYIFDRFYHVAKENQTASSGIGLALSKELTELLDGTIIAESTTGKGSKFTLTLPELEKNNSEYTEQNNTNELVDLKANNDIDKDKLYYDTTEISPEIFEIKEDKQYDETILIVEDNSDVRDYLLNLLKYNYHIIEAENGQKGLQQAFANTPDLIITDVMMPVMDGNDFTEQVKSDIRTSHIPVVMLTAKADIKNKLEGIEIGADDYLTKPFHPEELLVRCRNLIAQRKKLHKLFSNNHLTVDKISVNSLDKQFLDRLRTMVLEKFKNTTFDVEKLSSDMNMSRMNLYRKVKALTGITPVEYIKTMRLQHAKQLLEQQAGNIADIASMSGFDNPSYFSKCYKQKFGVVPSEHVKV